MIRHTGSGNRSEVAAIDSIEPVLAQEWLADSPVLRFVRAGDQYRSDDVLHYFLLNLRI